MEEVVAAAAAAAQPSFDGTLTPSSPFFFYHVVSPSTAELQVQVLGPNLSFTFSHARAQERFSAQAIELTLTKKTAGFLALVAGDTVPADARSSSSPPGSPPGSPPPPPRRTILAWAESGHGLGPGGDCLDKAPGVLSNGFWTRRVLAMSAMMGVNMGHPFDRLGLGGRQGMFRASHVEVKLAAHAIHTLLRIFGITLSSRRDLERLRTKICQGAEGTRTPRPRFEIYFSKKNCHACAAWIDKLETLTGVEIKLFWKDRLVKIEYAKSVMGTAAVAVPEVVVVDADRAHQVADHVDLTDSDVEEVAAPAAFQLSRGTPQPLGAYIDGLAYCVGQMASAPRRVTSAIVGLASMSRRQNLRAPDRRVSASIAETREQRRRQRRERRRRQWQRQLQRQWRRQTPQARLAQDRTRGG